MRPVKEPRLELNGETFTASVEGKPVQRYHLNSIVEDFGNQDGLHRVSVELTAEPVDRSRS
ncbi:MAG: hypothetical protein ABJF01_18765 [bacterium]